MTSNVHETWLVSPDVIDDAELKADIGAAQHNDPDPEKHYCMNNNDQWP